MSAPIDAHAASSSVGLSIHFEIAPIELIRPSGISVERFTACARLSDKLDILWAGRARAPQLNCRSQSQLPLIVTNAEDGRLIARP